MDSSDTSQSQASVFRAILEADIVTSTSSLVSANEFRSLVSAAPWNASNAFAVHVPESAPHVDTLYELGIITGILFRNSTELQEPHRLEIIANRLIHREPTIRLKLTNIANLVMGLVDGVQARIWIAADVGTGPDTSGGPEAPDSGASRTFLSHLRSVPPGARSLPSPDLPDEINRLACDHLKASSLDAHHLSGPAGLRIVFCIMDVDQSDDPQWTRQIIRRVITTTQRHLSNLDTIALPRCELPQAAPPGNDRGNGGTESSSKTLGAALSPLLTTVMERVRKMDGIAVYESSAGMYRMGQSIGTTSLPEVLTAEQSSVLRRMECPEPQVIHHMETGFPAPGATEYHGIIMPLDPGAFDPPILVATRRTPPFRDRIELGKFVDALTSLDPDAPDVRLTPGDNSSHQRSIRGRHQAPYEQPASSDVVAELRPALSSILADLHTVIPHRTAAIWLLEPNDRTLTLEAGNLSSTGTSPAPSIEGTSSLCGQLTRGRDAQAMSSSTFLNMAGLDASDAQGVPDKLLVGSLRDGDRTVGLLALGRLSTDQDFTDNEYAMFRVAARQLAISTQLSRTIESERAQRRQAQRLTATTAMFNRARQRNDVIAALQRGVARLMQIDHSHVALQHPDRAGPATLFLSDALSPGEDQIRSGDESSALAIEQELLRTRTSIIGDRMRHLVSLAPYVPPAGMHGLAAIPIRNGARLEGTLYLWSPVSPRDPDFRDLQPGELQTAESLCAQAAVALERVHLYDLAERSANEQGVISSVANQLSSETIPSNMVDAALNALAHVVPYDYGRVIGKQPDETSWQLLAAVEQPGHSSASQDAAIDRLEQWVRSCGHKWHGPLAVWDDDNRLIRSHVAELYAACSPLLNEDGVCGTLTVIRQDRISFAFHDLDLIANVAGQLALGLQRTESYSFAVASREQAEQYSSVIGHILSVSTRMSHASSLSAVLDAMATGLDSLVPFTSVAVFQADEHQNRLEPLFSRSRTGRSAAQSVVRYGQGLIGNAALRREPLQRGPDAVSPDEYPFSGQERDDKVPFSVLAYPMIIEGELIGVMVMERTGLLVFTDEELSILRIFSVPAASALRNARLMHHNRDLYLGGIRALSSAVDTKDPYTHGHSERVGALSRRIGEEMRLGDQELEQVEVAAILHDIGKIGIPDAILQKAGPLNQRERAVMMGHAELGAGILRNAKSNALSPLIPAVRHHHEWWDGRGYPAGLAGERIPMGARIISVADAFDTITTDRPYRSGRPLASARAILRDAAGTQFAPAVVEALERVFDTDGSPQGPSRLPLTDRDSLGHPPIAGVQGALISESATGQLGDLRSLGLLVELARITPHMTDLQGLLDRLAALLADHLGLGGVVFALFEASPNRCIHAVRDTSGAFNIHVSVDCEPLAGTLALSLPARLQDTPLQHVTARYPWLRSREAGTVALYGDGGALGVVIFQPSSTNHSWWEDLPAIESISPHISAAINVARLHGQVKAQAITDGLTGVLNHRGFYQSLSGSIDRGEPFSLVFFDVVGLKKINDSAGHLAGDNLLRQVSECIATIAGSNQPVARYGGDEFAAILEGSWTEQRLTRFVEEIDTCVRDKTGTSLGGEIAIRRGWSRFPDDSTTQELLVDIADKRMFGLTYRRADP